MEGKPLQCEKLRLPAGIRFTREFAFPAALLLMIGCNRGAYLEIVTASPGRPVVLPADGRMHRLGTVQIEHGKVSADELSVAAGAIVVPNSGGAELWVRSPVSAVRERLQVTHNRALSKVDLEFRQDDLADAQQPGFPDWMPLHTTEDREAFRRWFVAVAESAADLPPQSLPKEVTDCSALLRYSFREAVRAHDDKWYAQLGPEEMPALPSVQQWTYPNTPMGPDLFRTRPGNFTSADLTDGAFAQFADAKTLAAANTFFVSRSLARARPGDLIFYRLLEGTSQYHSMIVTGDHAEWVVYHTGPVTTPHGKTPGEMRRVLLADLVKHPDPRWRPVSTNENFLGVYRWDILDDDR